MAWPNVYDLDSSRFDREAAKQASKPVIVLIHDAFHTPSHLEPLVRELHDAGYRTSAPQLPSSTSICQSGVFEADVQAIYDHCKPEMDRGNNVILVLLGYGALPGSVAGDRLNRYALGRPRAGFVVRNIFVAAVIAKEGECLLDVIRPEWLVQENGVLGVRKPDQVFFQDCSGDQIRSAVSKLRPQIADSFRTRITNAGWTIPCVYVVCELDQAISPSSQRAFSSKLQAYNRHATVYSIQAGHSPYLSRTRETAALIVRLANDS